MEFKVDGEAVFVDECDARLLRFFQWRIVVRPHTKYVIHTKKGKTTWLHRVIMDCPAGMLVDHENRNGLDNRRGNLRIATHSQNSCNRLKPASSATSRYKGVYLARDQVRKSPWRAKIYVNRKKIHLGYFADEREAAMAYDEAALRLHGVFAVLNFPIEGLFAGVVETSSAPQLGQAVAG